MTTDVEKCRRILDTVRATGRHLTVTFNYRWVIDESGPVSLISQHADATDTTRFMSLSSEPSQMVKLEKVLYHFDNQNTNLIHLVVLSVHFEWLLDTVHGADYFRRWHRQKTNSGGLMVHKSGHHFDLVNWWLDARPVTVAGMGRLAFYGEKAGREHRWAKDYVRARGEQSAKDDPFAIILEDDETLKRIYADAEVEDGYHRDQNVSHSTPPPQQLYQFVLTFYS